MACVTEEMNYSTMLMVCRYNEGFNSFIIIYIDTCANVCAWAHERLCVRELSKHLVKRTNI